MVIFWDLGRDEFSRVKKDVLLRRQRQQLSHTSHSLEWKCVLAGSWPSFGSFCLWLRVSWRTLHSNICQDAHPIRDVGIPWFGFSCLFFPPLLLIPGKGATDVSCFVKGGLPFVFCFLVRQDMVGTEKGGRVDKTGGKSWKENDLINPRLPRWNYGCHGDFTLRGSVSCNNRAVLCVKVLSQLGNLVVLRFKGTSCFEAIHRKQYRVNEGGGLPGTVRCTKHNRDCESADWGSA